MQRVIEPSNCPRLQERANRLQTGHRRARMVQHVHFDAIARYLGVDIDTVTCQPTDAQHTAVLDRTKKQLVVHAGPPLEQRVQDLLRSVDTERFNERRVLAWVRVGTHFQERLHALQRFCPHGHPQRVSVVMYHAVRRGATLDGCFDRRHITRQSSLKENLRELLPLCHTCLRLSLPVCRIGRHQGRLHQKAQRQGGSSTSYSRDGRHCE
mmetsp:Transcript_1237/g.4115  ORF Transcript_1237/g.4115 Transcript_1237/m.4115 type:complete len:210 (-) Transcript_1237:233-862(-)